MRCEARLSLFGYVGDEPVTPMIHNPDFIKFSVAVTLQWKDKYGEKQSSTTWYVISTSQKTLGEFVKSYVKKGTAVYVEGAPKYKQYTGKDGTARFQVEVNLSKIMLLGSKGSEGGEGQATEPISMMQNPSATMTEPYAAGTGNFYDDEIPF